MIGKTEKKEIQHLVAQEIERLGGQRKVATKCRVSAATVSQVVNENWDLISEEMWTKIGAALGWTKAEGWQVVENTFNMKSLAAYLLDAKKKSMMLCVSYKAGSGKTAGAKFFARKYAQRQVYYIHCREWTIKQFLKQLCRALGIEQPRGMATADDIMEKVADFFLVRASKRPLLIVDEADKLKGSALRSFIPLFNATEDRLGIVLMGTEHLKDDIKRGVKYNKKGYDEIDSRLGRVYVPLYGATQAEVRAICKANGVTNQKKQNAIWRECEPRQVQVGSQFVSMVDDLRRLKRVVMRELITGNE